MLSNSSAMAGSMVARCGQTSDNFDDQSEGFLDVQVPSLGLPCDGRPNHTVASLSLVRASFNRPDCLWPRRRWRPDLRDNPACLSHKTIAELRHSTMHSNDFLKIRIVLQKNSTVSERAILAASARPFPRASDATAQNSHLSVPR